MPSWVSLLLRGANAASDIISATRTVMGGINALANPLAGLQSKMLHSITQGLNLSVTDHLTEGLYKIAGVNSPEVVAAEHGLNAFLRGDSVAAEGHFAQLGTALVGTDDNIGAQARFLGVIDSLHRLNDLVDPIRMTAQVLTGNTSRVKQMLNNIQDASNMVKDYRVTIKDGRVQGIYGSHYITLSLANEVMNPRKGVRNADDMRAVLKAYAQLPVVTIHGKQVELEGAYHLTPNQVKVVAEQVAPQARRAMRLLNASDSPHTNEAALDTTVSRLDMVKISDHYYARASERIKTRLQQFAEGKMTRDIFMQQTGADIRRLNFNLQLLSVGGIGNLNNKTMMLISQRSEETMRSLARMIDDIMPAGRQHSADAGSVPYKAEVPGKGMLAHSTLPPDKMRYREEGAAISITPAQLAKMHSAIVGPSYKDAQDSYRDTLGAVNDDPEDVYEVRRLEEGKENCPFCIEWADIPMPVGQLPRIGDGCYNVIYNGGSCYCKMDVPDESELVSFGYRDEQPSESRNIAEG